MTDLNPASRKTQIEKFATHILGAAPDEVVNPLTVLASPAWRGIEGDIWRVSTQTKSKKLWGGKNAARSAIVKHYHADTDFYVDVPAAFNAARQAGLAGVAPKVLEENSAQGLIGFEELDASWRAGGLHHVIDPDIRANIIEQKKAFQKSATLDKNCTIFDEIERFYQITQDEHIRTHNDIVAFIDFISSAKEKITALGWDNRPCHRDGNTANVMVHEDKSIQLIDFDLAANCDPFEDIGAYFVEVFETDLDARQGFEEWYGAFDEGLFQRAMIYGLADDLRWGLIGSIMGARSKRTELEFTKYAAWRFLRLQAQVKRSDAYDRIRHAA